MWNVDNATFLLPYFISGKIKKVKICQLYFLIVQINDVINIVIINLFTYLYFLFHTFVIIDFHIQIFLLLFCLFTCMILYELSLSLFLSISQ